MDDVEKGIPLTTSEQKMAAPPFISSSSSCSSSRSSGNDADSSSEDGEDLINDQTYDPRQDAPEESEDEWPIENDAEQRSFRPNLLARL